MFKKIYFLFIFKLLLFNGFSQNLSPILSHVDLNWKLNKLNLKFQQAVYLKENEYLPSFSFSKKFQNPTNVDIILTNEVYQTVDKSLFSEKQLQLIQNSVILKQNVGFERKQTIAGFSIFPYRYTNGSVEVLESFDYEIRQNLNQRLSDNSSSSFIYPLHSILQNGNWYKFGVSNAGIYKLDYTFLKNLGLNVDNLNPSNFRIFGHRSGMLPELAGAAREDDALEFPLKVVTANANQFKNGDYILVYLTGPEKWTYNTTKQIFVAQKHLYSDTKNFFITADLGAGARVSSINSSPLSETKTITTYNDYQIFEENKVNISESGRQFLGDEFGAVTDKSYAFSFPNKVASEPIKLNASFAAHSETSGSYFTTDISGSNTFSLFTSNVPCPSGICYSAVLQNPLYTFTNVPSSFNINLNFNRNGDFNTKGWLDYLQLNTISNLSYLGSPLLFRNQSSVGNGEISKFLIQNVNSNVEIWDVTNPFDVQKINYNLSGNTASFNITTDSLKEFVVFENTTLVPTGLGKISNSDYHNLPQQDYLIITRNIYLQQAEALAQFHRNKNGLRVAVVDYDKVCNEFSSGTNDITAMRNFVKMFYDRAAGNIAEMPRYLLLFGDGTFENKNISTNLLPTYQSIETFNLIDTYVADDYFGLLDDNEGANVTNTTAEKVDVGIGRIPCNDAQQAQIAVDKIKLYASKEAFGDWREQATYVADDEDYNTHLYQAETLATTLENTLKKVNIDKIYLDAYTQVSGTSGARYPSVNEAINNKIQKGTLFINYAGHGGPFGLAEEAVVTLNDISSWNNLTKLPLFITATCDFTPYDQFSKYSAGERILFKENGGGIGLVTTTRLVYSNENEKINFAFLQSVFDANNDITKTLGDMVRETKNLNFDSYENNRKFTLIGDPALRLAFPKNNVIITMIDSVPISQPHDTIKALSKIRINGEIQDRNNVFLPTFNGVVTINVYDKPKTITTLKNDDNSFPQDFSLQKNVIFKGKSKVINGKFEILFLVPKDINYTYGKGKISAYANSDESDADGYTTDIIIGGASDTFPSDNKGPVVDVFMNDDKFALGGITDENPKLFSKIFDENGINTSGNGVGHDITAIIDNNTKNIYTLNDFYEVNVDNNNKGTVTYPFSKLSKGRHTLTVKAWDVLNNSGEGYTEFVVEEKANLALTHVLNYPNPFTTNTRFMFEHNKPGVSLDLKIEIFTVSGKVIKTITKNINTIGYRVDDISWDGKDDFGDNIGRGVYIYKISLRDDTGKKVSQYQKLVILN